MRTTINIDDELLQVAADYTGINEKTELVRVALKQLIAYHAGLRLAKLGGSQPGIRDVPRRKSPA